MGWRILALTGWFVVVTTPSFAGQWKVAFDGIDVAPKKASGQPWDADNSGPDVYGEFTVGRMDGSRCMNTEKPRPFPKHENTYRLDPSIEIVVDAPALDQTCVRIRIVDSDAFSDDLIGEGAVVLVEGRRSARIGQALVSFTVASTSSVSAPAPTLPTPSQPRSGLYKVTLVTARIHATKSDGSTWDEPQDKSADEANFNANLFKIGLALASGGTGLVVGAVSAAIGTKPVTVSYKAQQVSQPDPRAVVHWGSLTFATVTNKDTFQPKWNLSFLVPAEIAENKPMRIEVLDADDGADETIAVESIAGKELVGAQVIRRTFGAVEELVMEVERVDEDSGPLEKAFKLQGASGWSDTGMDVVAGQTLQITATGQHCLANQKCVGPEGTGSVVFQDQLNDSGAAAPIHEGQLTAVIGNDIYPIGSASSFTAKASGRLLLGVASKVTSGSLSANVRVFYPLR